MAALRKGCRCAVPARHFALRQQTRPHSPSCSIWPVDRGQTDARRRTLG
jgi:hypothetical protein